MKRTLLTAVAVCSLAFAAGCATTADSQTAAAPAPATQMAEYPATTEGAAAFRSRNGFGKRVEREIDTGGRFIRA